MGRINLSRWIGLATAGATAAGLVLVVRWLASLKCAPGRPVRRQHP